MSEPVNLQLVGNNILATYDNDSTQFFVPTASGLFIPRGGAPDGKNGTPSSNDGDNGGTGTSADDDTDPTPNAPAPPDPEPVKSSPNGIDLYNPWKNVPITGSWQNHMSYSAGGIDYPLSYGTPIKAPASGTLHISGGSGEWAAGQVGSAGRRSILYLDKKFPRKKPRGTREGEGPLVAIVFQHQSKFGQAKHYDRGDVIGYSGASANGSDYGGEVHLQVHGLNRSGSRLNLLNYF